MGRNARAAGDFYTKKKRKRGFPFNVSFFTRKNLEEGYLFFKETGERGDDLRLIAPS